MFTFRGNQVYYKDLQHLTKSYNNSFHRSIKTKPLLVNKNNQDEIWFNLYGYKPEEGSENLIKFSFKVGDSVRITRNKYTKFPKGYTQNWSTEIFKVVKIISKDPPKYFLQDLKGEEIKGQFYDKEIQKVLEKELRSSARLQNVRNL